MTEPTTVLLDAEREASLRSVSQISYALHAVVAVGAVVPGFQPGVALLVVALVIDMVKRGEAVGSWQASHFSWRLRTVLWAAGLYALTSPLFLLLVVPGLLAWGLISLWFLYRVVRGWLALNDRRPMPS